MKYFTKYLPVEGEIKEGDAIILPNGNIYQYQKEYSSGDGLPVMQIVDSKDKKVKLFLCSRDIQRNDSVYITTQDYINRAPLLVQTHAIEALTKKGAFKVIGEISSDALSYIKEEQGLEEKDVEISMRCKECYGIAAQAWCGCTNEDIPFINVLGPCGRFH